MSALYELCRQPLANVATNRQTERQNNIIRYDTIRCDTKQFNMYVM